MKKKKTESRKKLTCTGILAKLLASLILGVPILMLSCSSVLRLYVWFSASNCQNSAGQAVVVNGITEFDTQHLAATQLTEENVSRIELLETFYLNRDRFDTDPNHINSMITHPSVNYILHRQVWGEYARTLSICGEGDFARKVIFITNGGYEITFTPDGDYFAIDNNRHFELTLYSASNLREYTTLSLPEFGHIRDVAFHPTQPLVAISSGFLQVNNYYVSIWNYETNERLSQFPAEITHSSIYFNQDGTAIINYSSTPNTPVYIWGVPSE